jgi:hypothetical protein
MDDIKNEGVEETVEETVEEKKEEVVEGEEVETTEEVL